MLTKATFFFSLLAITSISASAQPVKVFPVRVKDGGQSLNGEWLFKYIPTLVEGPDSGFSKREFNVSWWKATPVLVEWWSDGAKLSFSLHIIRS